MLPPKNYYDHMYDIEGLTSLNVAQSQETSAEIKEVETFIREQECVKARQILTEMVPHSKNPIDLEHMLLSALEIKQLLFEGVVKDSAEKSPKMCALEELGVFLKKPQLEIEKNMVVEEPVGKDWKIRKVDPTNTTSVIDFYKETDSYIYELMAANHIVQTLFTYAVMVERMKSIGVKSVLDYGAGIGTLSILLSSVGFDVTYAELPSKTAEFAKSRFKKRNLSIPVFELTGDERYDLSQPLFNDKQFDCILSTEVIEHVSKPLDLIFAFSEKLQSGGVVVVSESCEYTEQFASHLEQNKQYGGQAFIDQMEKVGFKLHPVDFFIPQLIFIKQ